LQELTVIILGVSYNMWCWCRLWSKSYKTA